MSITELNSPGHIGTLEVPNRFVFPSMLMNFASDRGEATERLVAFHRRMAAGGFGLIMTECVFPQFKGGIATRGLALYDDRFRPGFARLTEAVHGEGARLGAQIFFDGAGRTFASDETVSIGPSDLTPWGGPYMKSMTGAELEAMATDFAAASARAVACGTDLVELHMGHAHLLGRFLSPYFNRRTDEFGGSLDARLRFPLMVLTRVREAIGPQVPLTARMCLSEQIDGGIELSDAIAFGIKLREAGLDAIHTSVGTGTTPKGLASIFPTSFSAEVPFAEWAREFKRETGITTILAGKITQPETARRLLDNGDADFVSIGRAALADPDWPNHAIAGEAGTPCIGCNQGCVDSLVTRKEITCTVNPSVGFETDFAAVQPLARSDRFVVLGGGVAGITCALGLAQRGSDVVLYEATDQLGGQFRHCSTVPGKEQFGNYMRHLLDRLENSGVEVIFNASDRTASADAMKAAGVFWAGGAVPRPWEHGDLAVPRIDGWACFEAGLDQSGSKRITIIGAGQVGVDAALWLADHGHVVTLCDAADDPLSAFSSRRHDYSQALQSAGVECLWSRRAVEGHGDRLRLVNGDGSTEDWLATDLVVSAVGRVARPRPHWASTAVMIGDSNRVGSALDAIRQATFHAAFAIGMPEV